ncbi:MAG: SDR family NAD(P)-dependent oxidoreductase [Epsilonproteobacteria bacterium]|nr:SDR family NAD(P)-dependent oxidoreductase [Campylobacterota bacterium]OIO14723.1 MAG: short-chain dehydrogenase [Helicobacteraceae bacterium CG1_02_36_14]PIP09459.1 MAG: short-chain dehydrogenase [Sulfurimonas sp. CG23_combo_of_CG06-09_8_20_14_all_36_33]PIS26840.1 MAG: short-chain dehydrogenase [Sulfurimonas sp. CG08_land_8_20_14_0_20_36_33]PIU34186.1 MAG: short-chain dehydrogenase [Sulfurimonas sp. CG07_land_8_20_14_0_80_36_56]PIV05269.1 MAG: short-chain dehydrogenase [Sulfurimonas sp. CG
MKILITGASSGIGAELARQYASSNNELILLARREEKLQALKAELLPHAKSIKLLIADVTLFEELQEKMKAIDTLDMVILNAGISLGHNAEITPFKEFKKLYDVNLLANHAILEVLLPKFQAQKSGKIVFISSLASLISMPTAKAYSSSKRALNAYAEAVRYKYKKDGIKVITILPGFIRSELTDKNSFHMPFLLDTNEGVRRIVDAIAKEKRFYAFPLRFYLIISLLNFLPQYLRDKIVNFIN